MIIVLILIAIIIGAVVCWIINDKYYCKGDWAFTIAIVLTLIGFFGVIGVTAGICNAQINRDVKYQNAIHEKEMLEYRIEHMEENIIGNEMLYNDIVDFNNELRNVKKWANNPWTNWFYNQDIATIEYIEIDIG